MGRLHRLLAALVLLLLPVAAAAQQGPTLVTVAGAIGETNRGPFDPFHDAHLARLVDPFERAYALDAAALGALPQQSLTVQYPDWDGQDHRFTGPSVADLLALVGAEGAAVTFMGLDGYSARYERAVLEKANFLLATHMDGAALGLGGFGPAWLMVSPEIEPAFPDGKASDSGLATKARPRSSSRGRSPERSSSTSRTTPPPSTTRRRERSPARGC